MIRTISPWQREYETFSRARKTLRFYGLLSDQENRSVKNRLARLERKKRASDRKT